MGAHKEHAHIAAFHSWRRRAQEAEARVRLLEEEFAETGESLLALSRWIERDRREPDKVLTYAYTLRTRAHLILMGEEEPQP